MQAIFFYNRQSVLIGFFSSSHDLLKIYFTYSCEIMSSHLQFTRDWGYESDDKNFEYVKGSTN